MNKGITDSNNWKNADIQNFWKDIAPHGQQFHKSNAFLLYCAYSIEDYQRNPHYFDSIIFTAYTKEIDGKARPSTEIYYKPVN